MGVHAHINIPIPITHTPTSKTHSLPHGSFPSKQPPSPHTISQIASRPCSQHTDTQLLTKAHGVTQMSPKNLGREAEGKCSISRVFQCTCNLIASSSKLASRSKISQVGHSRSEGDENDYPSLGTGHGSMASRGLVPTSCQCYNIFPLIIHTRKPWMSVRP